MSVKKLLEGSVFDPDQVRDLTRVYREVTAALSLTTRAAKEDAAKAIIRIAREQTDFDAAKLRGQVMDELAREP
jgi:phosphopantetheine adenylyltransferase